MEAAGVVVVAPVPANALVFLAVGLRRGHYSHFDAPLYILYGESLMNNFRKYAGWCQNDFSVQG